MMKYTNEQIDLLRSSVEERLSEKRFSHTLGVENMAVRIGEKCLPDSLDIIRAAALLHDISKEYSEAEHFNLINHHKIKLSEHEKDEPALWHSVTAPLAVIEDYPEFADPSILSAVRNHTVGSPDMSVLDEIILLSDYIEEGRTYDNCVNLRRDFIAELDALTDPAKCINALHRAVARSLDNNIKEFTSRGKAFHVNSLLARDAVLKKSER